VRTALFTAVLAVVPAVLVGQDASPSDWAIALGAGAIVVPDYVGSDDHRMLPFPMVQVTYRNRFFLGPSSTGLGGGVGAHLVRSPGLELAAELGIQDGRPAKRADALVGMDDRSLLGTAGASVGYALGPARATAGVSRGLNDDAGWSGTAHLAFTRPLTTRLVATTAASVALADTRQMRRDFGVTATEAARRQALIDEGDPRLGPDESRSYHPDGGLWQVGASISLLGTVSQRWSVLAFGGVNWLTNKATNSPLVRKRDQPWAGLGLMWRR
jgi:outer membrane protein